MRLKDEFKVDQGYKVDPRRIEVVPGLNHRRNTPEYREYQKGIKELIRVNGVTEPLTIRVEGEHILLCHGHTRLWSVMSLTAEGEEWQTIPCRLEAHGVSEADRYALQVVQNTTRQFDPLDTASVVKDLLRLGWDEDKIAKRLNISTTRVKDLLKLLECAQEVINQVESGTVSASLAVQVQKSNPAEAPSILQEAREIAKAQGKTKTTPKHVKEAVAARSEAEGNPAQTNWAKVGPKLLHHLDAILAKADGAITRARAYRKTLGE
jgi:ParB-like chromosome segregation protein Spo0J